MNGWAIAGCVYGASLLLFAGLILANTVGARRRIKARRPMQVDTYPFLSEVEQEALYARFWEIVSPLRDSNAPVVPGDGGEPRWTS